MRGVRAGIAHDDGGPYYPFLILKWKQLKSIDNAVSCDNNYNRPVARGNELVDEIAAGFVLTEA